MLGALLKLSVSERQATSQWKSTREPLRRNDSGNGSSAIRHFEQGDEDVTE